MTRSIWHQVLGNCKTEASAKPVPMDSYMAEDLLRWRRQSVYASDDHYVFASETMKGKQPYWPDNLMKRHIQPVAKAIGIHKKIGWHTFRHSFGTLLKANGEDVKTVQELLRHANSRITLDVYTQAVNSNKRAAQSKVVRMIVSNAGQKVEEKCRSAVSCLFLSATTENALKLYRAPFSASRSENSTLIQFAQLECRRIALPQ